MTGTRRPGRPLRRWLLQAAGSAVLLGIVLWWLPLDALGRAIATVPPAQLLVVLLGFLGIQGLAAAKWWWLLDRRLPLPLAVRAHLAGLAANLCLPGAIGGDLVRAGIAHGVAGDLPRIAAAGAADRLVDLAALVLLAGAGLLLAQGGGDGGDGLPVLQALGLLAVVAAGVATLPRTLPLPWRLWPGLPGRGAALRMAEALGEVGRRPARLLGALALSVVLQGMLVALSWWLARAAGTTVAPGPWLFAWTLAKISAVLPVSLNGLGLREGVLAAILSRFGAAPAPVVAAGLLWQAVLFAGGAVGLVVYLLSQRAARAPAARASGA